MDPYVIFAFYNADQIQGVLNAIVMLVGSGSVDGDYLSLLRIAGMLGLFVAVAVGFLRARGEDAGMYLIMMAIFYSTLFIPRVTVTIQDVGYAAGAPRTVANVPIGLAFFASATSKIGYWLTDRSETVFAFPDENISFRKGGMMGASRALREAQGATFSEPILAQDMQLFMRDCINPEILLNPPTLTALMASRAIWTDFSTLGLVNAGRIVTLASQPTATNCDNAYTNILTPRIAGEVNTEMGRIARLLNPYISSANASTALTTLLPASEGMIMTASASATESIQQRMMINLLNDTSQTLGQVMNDPTAVQNAIASAQASASANSSYRIMAKLASETLPMIRNAIELVIIGVFPFMLVLVIVAGAKGGIVLRSYVMAMLWVQLWAPLYAIVNYVGTLSSAKRMSGSLEGIDGVTVQNAAQMLNTTISGEAVVGLLTISVPIIALALVKGGEMAMSGVVSGLMGPAQHSADKTGQAVGSGNIQAGNVSWGNYSSHSTSGHKHDTDFSNRSGAYSIRNTGGDVETRFQDGTGTMAQAKHDSLFGGMLTAGSSKELSSQAGRQVQAGLTNVKSAFDNYQAIISNASGRLETGGVTNSQHWGVGSVEQGGRRTELASGRGTETSVGAEAAGRFANSGRQQFAFQGQAGANASLTGTEISGGGGNVPAGGAVDKVRGGKNANVTAGIGGRFAQLQEYMASVEKAYKRGDLARATEGLNVVSAHLSQMQRENGFKSVSQGGTTNRDDIEARLSRANQYLSGAQANLQKAESLQEASRIMQNVAATGAYNQLADPRIVSADQQKALVAEYRAAKTGEERAAVLEKVAQLIGGDALGRTHAVTHMSGEEVKSTESKLDNAHSVNSAQPVLQNNALEVHNQNRGAVPAGRTGASTVVPQAGLESKVDGAILGSKAEASEKEKQMNTALGVGNTIHAAQTGFVNPDPKNPETGTFSKLGNVADSMATSDMGMSLKQLVPNALGGAPTLEQHQDSIGYNRDAPGQSRPMGAENNQSIVAPPNWMPKEPPKARKAAGE